jgi:ABC-2 type transport system permease protein
MSTQRTGLTMTARGDTSSGGYAPGGDALGGAMSLPGIWRTGLARSAVELKSFFRNRQSLVFSLALPVVLLLVLGSIFSGTVKGTDVSFRLVFMAGIIAAGVMSVAFSGLAINLAIERDNGTIRRLATTPMPRAAYFGGKVSRVVVTSALETAVLIAVGAALFHLPLPSDPARWFTLVWVLALGTTACALLALVYSLIIPNSRSAAAIVTPPFLVLQFISGVFFPFNQLPRWMQTLAAFFPLKWMAQGLRSVFLPSTFQAVEPGHSFDLGKVALVLGVWCIGCLLVSLAAFRWHGPRVG